MSKIFSYRVEISGISSSRENGLKYGLKEARLKLLLTRDFEFEVIWKLIFKFFTLNSQFLLELNYRLALFG